jgi:hypothetical protein
VSLSDELQAECRVSDTTETWFEKWRETLSPADRAVIDEWIADDRKPGSAIYRVLRSKGYAGAPSTFRGWLGQRRGTR